VRIHIMRLKNARRPTHSLRCSSLTSPTHRVLPPCACFRSLRSRLHSMEVLHRDVKLENLLCDTSTRPPRVKLCDFGHAILVRDLSRDRQFYGTPGYAAPEVTQGPVWSASADVWAMGVVMYALLANSLPFEGDEGWRRPADLSSRVWWRVSLEARLLLQALLEVDANQRGTLDTFAQSTWRTLNLSGRHRDEPMRHSFSYSDVQRSIDQQAFARRLHMPHAASWNCLEGASGPRGSAEEEDALMAELLADDGINPMGIAMPLPPLQSPQQPPQQPALQPAQPPTQQPEQHPLPSLSPQEQEWGGLASISSPHDPKQMQHLEVSSRQQLDALLRQQPEALRQGHLQQQCLLQRQHQDRLPRSSPAVGGFTQSSNLHVDLTDSTAEALGFGRINDSSTAQQLDKKADTGTQ
jgi:serine/threonine protein kinase